MLSEIKKSMKRNEVLNMIYMANGRTITKRRIKVFSVNDKLFHADD